MKFIHTADLHIDRNFEGLGKVPEELEKKLVAANQQLLKAIVDLAIDEKVDCLILAGDTFHKPQPTIRMQAIFTTQMERLRDKEIPVFLSSGNHDFVEKDRFWFAFPDNVIWMNQETVTTYYWETRTGEQIAVSGFGYEHRWLAGKAAEFPKRSPEADIHIGIYHGDRQDTSSDDMTQQYAPFTLDQLKLCGYDYWALGHIHQPQILQTEPLIVYPGTPQGHNRKEQNLTGIAIVENQRTSSFKLTWHKVAAVAWETIRISLMDCRRREDIKHSFESALLEAARGNDTQVITVAIELTDFDSGILGTTDNQIKEEISQWLEYLQTSFYEKQQQRIWVFTISLLANGKEQAKLVNSIAGIDQALLQRLGKTYSDPVYFDELIADLYQSPQLVKSMEIDDAFRLDVVTQAEKLLGMRSDEMR